MDQRLNCFLEVMANKVSPVVVAECFLDPCVSAEALIENDEGIQNLKEMEEYMTHSLPPRQQKEEVEGPGDTEVSETTRLPKRPRKCTLIFKFI